MNIRSAIATLALVTFTVPASAAPLAATLGHDARVPLYLQHRDVDINAPLAELNFVTDHGLIIVTGLKGDGVGAVPYAPEISVPLDATSGASVLSEYKTVDTWRQLESIPLNESGTLVLPDGKYKVTHDNGFDYGPEGKTWIGFLNDDKNYRVIVTAGQGSVTGTLLTPTRRFSLEGSRLVDLSTLKALPFDDHVPVRAKKHAGLAVENASKVIAKASGSVVVDVLVFYDPTVNHNNPKLRIRHLAALANQSYVDSGIRLQIRLVAMRKLKWLSRLPGLALDNDVLLERVDSLLTTDPAYSGPRERRGADLVTVIRPNRTTQQSCGLGYIGGAEGSSFVRDTGLAVVSDGIDEANASSCDDYTFAHELGHNLGSAHDRPNAEYAGHFEFSYGRTGIDTRGGQWYTIMAYPQAISARLVPKFSSPNLWCAARAGGEVPCGSLNEDNAQSIDRSAASVAAYTPNKL